VADRLAGQVGAAVSAKPRGPEPTRVRSVHRMVVVLLGIAAGYLLVLFVWPLLPAVLTSVVRGGVYVLGAVGLVVGPVRFVGALSAIEMARASLGPAAGDSDPGGVGILLHPAVVPPARARPARPLAEPRATRPHRPEIPD
jgi:hypothetical protein